MAGRPTKFTPAVQQRILDAIALGLTYEQAATSAGITRETFRQWRDAKLAFSAELEKAEVAGMAARLSRIQMAAVRDGAWQADAWWLERRFPDQWGRRERVDVNHSGSIDVSVLAELRTVVAQAFPDDPDAPLRIADALANARKEQQGNEQAS